jgi:hypothetical protein
VKEPRTPAQWQEAVDLADFYVRLDSARKYGLVTGGPDIDLGRCEELLKLGRLRGVRPSPGSVDRLARAFAAGA